MSSDCRKCDFRHLGANGCTVSQARKIRPECGWTRRIANLYVSLTNRRGRFQAPHIDLRERRVEVVGTDAEQIAPFYIYGLYRKSSLRPQIPERVYVPFRSRKNVCNRRCGRILQVGKRPSPLWNSPRPLRSSIALRRQ